jgi:hypothetical protein
MRLTWLIVSVSCLVASTEHAGACLLDEREISGGQTDLRITVDLDNLGVDVTPLGDTTVDALGRFLLPITEATVEVNPLGGEVEHEGSGLRFGFGGASLDVDNLEFDFDHLRVTGEVTLGSITALLGIFNIVPCIGGECTAPGGMVPITGFGLFLRQEAEEKFESFFGDRRFDVGDQIALANMELKVADGPPVPEPTLLMLLGLALAGMAVVRRPVAGDQPSS